MTPCVASLPAALTFTNLAATLLLIPTTAAIHLLAVEEAAVEVEAPIMTMMIMADCLQAQKNVIRVMEHASVQRAMERVRAQNIQGIVSFVAARGYASFVKV